MSRRPRSWTCGPLPASPAEVVAHTLLGNAGQGVIERVDVPGLHPPVLLERGRRNHHVPRFAEPGIVDLEDEPGVDDGPVLGAAGPRRSRTRTLRRWRSTGSGRVPTIAGAMAGTKASSTLTPLQRGLEGGEVPLEQRLALVARCGPRHTAGGAAERHRPRQVFLVVLTERAPLPPWCRSAAPTSPRRCSTGRPGSFGRHARRSPSAVHPRRPESSSCPSRRRRRHRCRSRPAARTDLGHGLGDTRRRAAASSTVWPLKPGAEEGLDALGTGSMLPTCVVRMRLVLVFTGMPSGQVSIARNPRRPPRHHLVLRRPI